MVRPKFSARCSVFALTLLLPASAFAQVGAPQAAQPYPSPYPQRTQPQIQAQSQSQSQAQSQALPPRVQSVPVLNPNDPAAMLPVYLKILSQSPYDVDALTNAGGAALAVGDPSAAVGFLARAEELSPRNARVKTLLGSALTMMEKPDDGLRYFNEAMLLGMLERDVAKDRGLAFDLRGDPKRAQKDYQTAARFSSDPEITRRHALSLGITGDKQEALDKLEPLIRRNDQGAWRARAFVMAMNGDLAEASRIARQVTPLSMAASMDVFLRRLASLNAGQRAHAVNFGTMPADGVRYASVDTGETFRAISPETAAVLSPRAAPALPQRAARVEVEDPKEARRREKRERELEKLAERSRRSTARGRGTQVAVLTPPKQAAPATSARIPFPPSHAAVTPATLPPFAPDPNSRRVGQRIGPVDPDRLPPELRTPAPSTAPNAAAHVLRATVVQGVTVLPPPDGVRPLQSADLAPIAPPKPPASNAPPAQVAAVTPPKPVFEVPAANPDSPKPAAPILVGPKVDTLPTGAVAKPIPPLSAPQVPAPVNTSPPTAVAKAPETAQVPVADRTIAVSAPIGLPPVPAPVAASPAPNTASSLASVPALTAPSPAVSSPPVSNPLTSASTPTQIASVTLPPSEVVSVPAFTTSVPVDAVPPAAKPAQAITTAPPAVSSPIFPPALAPKPVEVAVANPNVPPSNLPSPAFNDVAPPVASSADVVPPAAVVPAVAATAEAPQPAGIGSVIAGLELEPESTAAPVPTDAELRAIRLAAQRKAEAKLAVEAKVKEKAEAESKAAKLQAENERLEEEKKKAEAAAELKKNPARLWVQIATGANRSGLPITWKKLKGDAPKALADQSAWFATFRATNRLLVGPVKSAAAARALVTALSKEGVQANSWSSEAGQEVSRLGGR